MVRERYVTTEADQKEVILALNMKNGARSQEVQAAF
jgi:hypothetical protein